MRDDTLEELYIVKPVAKAQIDNAAGYGVFSNIGTNLLLLSTGSGFGIVTDAKTGDETYMKMASGGLGLGIGIKDFRSVVIFRNRQDLLRFMEKGWDFSGQADAAAKSGEKGLAGSTAQSTDFDIVTYQLTQAGIAIQATLQGTKYWRHPDLN